MTAADNAFIPQKLITLRGKTRTDGGLLFFPVVLDGAEVELACGFSVAIELVTGIQKSLTGHVIPWPGRRPKATRKAAKRKAPATKVDRRR